MTDQIAKDHLRSFIERVERMNEEIKALQADRKEIYAEAKGAGFDVPAMKAIVRLRGMEDHDREEREQILDLYKHSLGMG